MERHLHATGMLMGRMPVDNEITMKSMHTAAENAGFTVVGEVSHSFSPIGFTGAIILSTSHATIHTWPERDEAYIDCYTCSSEHDPVVWMQELAYILGCDLKNVTEISRDY